MYCTLAARAAAAAHGSRPRRAQQADDSTRRPAPATATGQGHRGSRQVQRTARVGGRIAWGGAVGVGTDADTGTCSPAPPPTAPSTPHHRHQRPTRSPTAPAGAHPRFLFAASWSSPTLLLLYSTAPNREGGMCAYNNNGLWQLAGRDQIQGAQTAVAAVAQIHTLARSTSTSSSCPWILAWPGLSASTFVRVCVCVQPKLKIAQQR